MASYQWTGINKKGERLKGVIEAIDIKSAETDVKKLDVDIISIREKYNLNIQIFRKKVSRGEVVLFTRYLSTMLSAGLPILQAIEVIGKDEENETFRGVITSIRNNIASGMTFSESLSQFPQYFSKLYCSLVRAGEKSGTLDKVLQRLSRYLERSESLRKKVKSAMIYPITICVVALVVSLILLIFVIPQFQVLFANAHVSLPYITMMMIGLSQALKNYGWLFILVLLAMYWYYKYFLLKNERFRNMLDRAMLRVVVIGPLLRKAIIARFSSTLAITLDAGLPIVESMKAMVDIMGNSVYSKAIKGICDDLVSGHSLSSSMSNTRLFPTMVVQMITVGEASGSLPAMLNNIADYYQEEVDSIVKNLSSLLEPFIIVILGIIIGTFVIAMYMPIFKLGTTI